jgi:monoamine oxidase
MSRSSVFRQLARIVRLGMFCEKHGMSTSEGIERFAAKADAVRKAKMSRRDLLAAAGKTAVLGAVAGTTRAGRALAARPPVVDVAIVGGGIAGLTCADTLQAAGVNATMYEARDRLGGRIWSMGGTFPGPVKFPGQVVERGGEFIDTTHLTIKSYAQEFKLKLEDVNKAWLPGGDTFYFNGARVPESVVVDEFRALVDRLRRDLSKLSNFIDVNTFTEFDRQLDFTSLAAYLAAHDAGENITKLIDVAYTTEYGCEISELSCLAFLFFIHIDKRSKFTPFGVFSDERYHVVDGNQQIPQGIADRLEGPQELEARLVAARKLASGRVELTFDHSGQTFSRAHDAVVFALPFTMLREVELDPSLGLQEKLKPDGLSKLDVINTFVLGTNAKMNVGFNGRFWAGQNSSGETWSDLPNHQLTWEVNPSRVTTDHAVIVDYSGGLRGAQLDANRVQREAELWLTDLDKVLPGALASATRVKGKYLAHLQHWPSDPFIKGSYTCNQPGYFTTILGHEATPVGNLYFAGEHTDQFYEWQGFMEGGANSGIRAATEILGDFS